MSVLPAAEARATRSRTRATIHVQSSFSATTRAAAPSCAYALPVAGEPGGEAREFSASSKRREQAVRAVPDVLGGRRIAVGDHREPARHRFDGDVAVGLGRAREQEDVARGVVHRRGPRPCACRRTRIRDDAPAGRRDPARRPRARAARADSPRASPRYALEHQRQVLLRRDAPDVERHHVVACRRPSSRATARCACPGGTSPRPRRAPRRAGSARRCARAPAHVLGRHHGAQRPVVKPPQVGGDRLLEPADAVVPAVGMEIRVKVAGDGNPELLRGGERRPAQRSLGHDVHDVRARSADHRRSRARSAGNPSFNMS